MGMYTTNVGPENRAPARPHRRRPVHRAPDHGGPRGGVHRKRSDGSSPTVSRDLNVDIVASVATMGIPLAIEVSRALGIDDYLIFQKTPKIHLADAISEPVKSITTGGTQRLLFDRARVQGCRRTARRPRRRRDIHGSLGEGGAQACSGESGQIRWRWACCSPRQRHGGDTLGADADLVRSLGAIPLFR